MEIKKLKKVIKRDPNNKIKCNTVNTFTKIEKKQLKQLDNFVDVRLNMYLVFSVVHLLNAYDAL